MKQEYCVTLNGLQFCEETKLKVWNKAIKIKGKYKQANKIRKDKFGNEIHFDKYGNTNSRYGWEIDHSKPRAKEGKDHINNLQPLQWKENRIKSDYYPYSIIKRKRLIDNMKIY